eukprot:466936_1
MADEKKQLYDFKHEDEDCNQESIVHGDGDHRTGIIESDHKEEYIIKCIGQLESNFKYTNHGYESKSSWGTGTVFYSNNQQTQKCYVITVAHVVQKKVFECNNCSKYTDNNRYTCDQCNVQLTKKIIKATNIRFRRREIERNTSHTNEDGDTVHYSFGDNRKCYQCEYEYVHYLYDTNVFTKSGYDWCILSFINTDGYNYSKYCRNIQIKNEFNKASNKQLVRFYIFGYPLIDSTNTNKMFGDQSTSNNYCVKIF